MFQLDVLDVLVRRPFELYNGQGGRDTAEGFHMSDAADGWCLAVAAHPSCHDVWPSVAITRNMFDALIEST